MKEKMSKKREASGLIEDEILYCNELLELINNDGRFVEVPSIEENINLMNLPGAEPRGILYAPNQTTLIVPYEFWYTPYLDFLRNF